ncbi:MAG: hypothetical protein EB127_16000 [Alphaproteobacteria bacterium]|nr:hypothetical protein [Alphaproteobacteria bacterium]
MIKEIGTLGLFIKFNDSASAGIKLFEIFSSSAATSSLFSASTRSNFNISFSASTASFYNNGIVSNPLYDNEWQHITFTFNPKLQTDSSNNFLIRFGQTASGDFQIQNIYMLDTAINSTDVRNIHNAFTGASISISTGETASGSIRMIDKDEALHSSSVTSTIYQPYQGQGKFIYDINLVTASSLSVFVSSSALVRDFRYFDGVLCSLNDRVLSLADNNVYQVNSSNGLTLLSTSNGDYVNVLSGIEYKNTKWLKTSGSFSQMPFLNKINYSLDITQQE